MNNMAFCCVNAGGGLWNGPVRGHSDKTIRAVKAEKHSDSTDVSCNIIKQY